MNISERIESLRVRRGISLTHLNKAIGAYRGKITDVKSGKASFTKNEIAILASELSTSTDYLLGNTDNPEPAGEIEKPRSNQEKGLSVREDQLIKLFRMVPEEKQDALLQAIEISLRSQGLL